MREFTLAEQVACVEREIAMRRLIYPRWVRDRKMPQDTADVEIAKMRAVLATMQGLAAGSEVEAVAVEIGGQRSLF